jgi:hypothetical protein
MASATTALIDIMIFKNLQKLVQRSSQSNLGHVKLFERLRNKPFWIWSKKNTSNKTSKTRADCWF